MRVLLNITSEQLHQFQKLAKQYECQYKYEKSGMSINLPILMIKAIKQLKLFVDMEKGKHLQPLTLSEELIFFFKDELLVVASRDDIETDDIVDESTDSKQAMETITTYLNGILKKNNKPLLTYSQAPTISQLSKSIDDAFEELELEEASKLEVSKLLDEAFEALDLET